MMFPFPRDTLTQCYAKSILLSEAGVASINQKIPRKKLMFFFDFKHMGLPNKFGLRSDLNKFLAQFPTIRQKVFADFPHEIIRLGGDEFVIFLSNSDTAINKVKNFTVEIRKLRDKFLSEKNEVVIEAEKVAHLRQTMRRLRWDFCHERGDFSIDQFCDFLKGRLKMEKINIDSKVLGTEIFQRAGLLQRAYVLGREKTLKKEKLLEISGVLFSLEDLTPAVICQALVQAEEKVSAMKQKGAKRLYFVPQKLEDRKLSEAELSEIKAWEDHEKKYQLMKKTGSIEESFFWSDPIIEGVLRLNLCANQKIGRIFEIDKPTDFQVMIFKLIGFGAINNNLGYLVADQIYKEVVEIVRKFFPSGIYVRSNGGRLSVFLPIEEFNESHFHTAWEEVNRHIWQQTNDPRVIAEVSEKRALATLYPKNKNNPFPPEWHFGEAMVDVGVVRLDPDRLIAEI